MKILKLVILLNLTLVINLLSQATEENTKPALYKNPAFSIEERVNDLVSRMTLDEKISQMINSANSIDRLGVPDYNWWSEGLHGVATQHRKKLISATYNTLLVKLIPQ